MRVLVVIPTLNEAVNIVEVIERVRAAVPPAEIDRLFPDSTAIRERLGWAPRWDLERGLEATYRWYERYLTGEAGAFVADAA